MKCTFCDEEIARGTGKTYVKNDGKVLQFCSRKCEKNMLQLGRVPRRTRWTGLAHTEKKTAGTKK